MGLSSELHELIFRFPLRELTNTAVGRSASSILIVVNAVLFFFKGKSTIPTSLLLASNNAAIEITSLVSAGELPLLLLSFSSLLSRQMIFAVLPGLVEVKTSTPED